MGGRGFRIARELSGLVAVSLARPVVVVGAESAVGDGCGRDAARAPTRAARLRRRACVSEWATSRSGEFRARSAGSSTTIPFPDSPIELTEREFADAVALLAESGFPIEREADAAWPHFRGWRVNYEDLAYRWANRVVAPLAPWSGARPGIAGGPVAPRRPSHRSPDDPFVFERPEFPASD